MGKSWVKIAVVAAAITAAGACAAWAATMTEFGESRTEAGACQAAKDNAARRILQEFRIANVDEFTPCACAFDAQRDTWRCSVTARFTPPS